MRHIRTQWEIFRQIIKENSVDVYDFLQLAQWWRENYLKEIEKEFIDKQNEELKRYIIPKLQWTPNLTVRDIEEEFSFWIEKNRWFPLWMGELSDISEATEARAKDNWYGYLYCNDD